MKACYEKATGEYITNEQSWAGEPKWPDNTTVMDAGDTPWRMKFDGIKLVEDSERITEVEADRAIILAKQAREAKIQAEMHRMAEQNLINRGEISR